MNRKETLKKRYQVYRALGYNSKTSRALSFRTLDVSSLEISKKTGKLKQNKATKTFLTQTMKEWKNRDAIDNYREKIRSTPNDTTYSRHGMFIQDKRYKGETGRTVSIIKNENNLTTDQAYFFFYTMTTNNLTYTEAKKQLLTNKEFEIYVSKGRRSIMSEKAYQQEVKNLKTRATKRKNKRKRK